MTSRWRRPIAGSISAKGSRSGRRSSVAGALNPRPTGPRPRFRLRIPAVRLMRTRVIDASGRYSAESTSMFTRLPASGFFDYRRGRARYLNLVTPGKSCQSWASIAGRRPILHPRALPNPGHVQSTPSGPPRRCVSRTTLASRGSRRFWVLAFILSACTFALRSIEPSATALSIWRRFPRRDHRGHDSSCLCRDRLATCPCIVPADVLFNAQKSWRRAASLQFAVRAFAANFRHCA